MNRFLRLVIDFFRNPGTSFRNPGDKKLKSVDMAGFAEYLKSCQNVVVLAGAGVSTSAGIPDFRSPNEGIYAVYNKYDLPYPEAIFSIDYFKKDPRPFFEVAKAIYPKKMKPTTAHYFVDLLHRKKKLRRMFTQNVDCLEFLTDLPADAIMQAHGTFTTSHCMKCKTVYHLDWLKEQMFSTPVPTCSKENCGGVVKPDVVLFGEYLPPSFDTAVHEDLKVCDCLIIMGTSLNVQPFASIISHVSKDCPRLLINREDIGGSLFSDLRYDLPHNYRDVFMKTNTDDGCMQLAEAMGLGDELKAIIESGNARLDELSKRDGGLEKEITKKITSHIQR